MQAMERETSVLVATNSARLAGLRLEASLAQSRHADESKALAAAQAAFGGRAAAMAAVNIYLSISIYLSVYIYIYMCVYICIYAYTYIRLATRMVSLHVE